MKQLQRFTVWAVVVFCCLFEISRAQCDVCKDNVTFITTTTSISVQNCNVSINENSTEETERLEPGRVYSVQAKCFNCCANVTTKPEQVVNVIIISTTSSLSLMWEKPNGTVSGYDVSWTDGEQNDHNVTNLTTFEIPNLTSGVKYNVTVTAVAGDERTTGQGVTLNQYTKPTRPDDVTLMERGTNSLKINWTLPGGRVDHYEVQAGQNKNKTNSLWFQFLNLSPGRLYTISVTAVAGNFTNPSEPSEFATYPLPPESVTVTGRTNSSLDLSWGVQTQMQDAPDITYNITYDDSHVTSANSTTSLTPLMSGTYYNITVKTVGPQGLLSTEVNIRACTNPNPVLNLRAFSESSTSIKVEWSSPLENNQSYSYKIVTYNSAGNVTNNQTVKDNSANVPGLDPGTNYTISVTTLLSSECKSTKVEVSSYTEPTRPDDVTLMERGTNSLKINWTLPGGRVDHYEVQAGQNKNKTNFQWFQFLNLSPGRLYTINVTAVAGNFTNSSEPSEFATYPLPPESVTVTGRTNSSLDLSWGVQTQMQDAPDITYNITYDDSHVTSANSTTSLTPLMSGTYYNITVKTVGPQGLLSTEVNIRACTNPNPVLNLRAFSESSTSIKVEWSSPLENNQSYSYKIVTYNSAGNVTNNQTVKDNSANVPGLDPGTNYMISVTTLLSSECKSTKVEVSSYTEPTRPDDVTLMERGTNSLKINWTLPGGRVDHYEVQAGQNKNKTNSLWFQFLNLSPGRLYTISVTAVAGNFTNSSEPSEFATYPLPPESVTVTGRTNSSLDLSWGVQTQMQDAPDITYNITYDDSHVTSANSTTSLTPLMSGTYYNITVKTVGPQGLLSTEVNIRACTNPNPVLNLRAFSESSTSIKVEWSSPLENNQSYSYKIVTYNSAGNVTNNQTVKDNSANVPGLDPGTNYTISVTTLLSSECKSTKVEVSSYTEPANVTITEVSGTTTNLTVSWNKAAGKVDNYTVNLYNKSGQVHTMGPFNDDILTATFTDLKPGVLYCAEVVTRSGPMENKSSKRCNATFPTPPGSISVSDRTERSITFSWDAPKDMSPDQYHFNVTVIDIRRETQENPNIAVSGLVSGSPYTVVVVTIGVNDLVSQEVTYTAYTKPYPVTDLQQTEITTELVTLKWNQTEYKPDYKYLVQVFNTSGLVTKINVTDLNYTEIGLMSGTNYSFSVTAQTADGTAATPKTVSYFTRPFSVKNLQASANETVVTLKWQKPDQYKNSYSFRVQNSSVNSSKTQNFIYPVSDLVPGSSYRFNVTTETSDGTQGAPESVSICTTASAVDSIKCGETKNLPNATVTWNWSPVGNFSHFLVQFEGSTTITTSKSFVKGDLKHYTEYVLWVTTQSCGESSTRKSQTCRTGITDPPLLKDYQPLIQVANVKHNDFTINISRTLLNDANGPIKNVGVLVSETANDPSRPEVVQYLASTYTEWEAGKTEAYLATVISVDTRAARDTTNTLSINVGDESMWNGYSNGLLKPTRKYKFAVVVFTSIAMNGLLISGSESLFSNTGFDNVVTLPQSPVVIGIAVGVTLGIFCFLLLVLIGFIIYWRRLAKKESSDIQIHSLRSFPVRVEDYEVYYKKQKADSACGFAEEYEEIKVVGTAQAKTSALIPENKPKNRYSNVLPYDASRVKLSIIHGNPIDDYINANYIPGYNSRKEFIAAQGPLPATVSDFWRMIWEKNVQTMVMLTRCNEQGRVKCEQYWTSGSRHYENITVTTTSEIPLDDWTIRDFDVKNVKTAETRSVRQFHFTAWPDHGVPETTELLISFRHLVREHMDRYRNSPTVVHCSAGVGRTGTFIAIDRLLFQIERENVVDIYGIVHDMRMHRTLMVQTEDQYVFLHQCALDIIRSRTGNNVDLIYQNMAALNIYENIDLQKK
ncbi:receptor-type tyrosine-protein phosphatase eta [Periophthalmus magnuspinnatus]|uniref:receptor-type tyrosine-protein phosphatase eta n=1 Tax=Periophthalmus magnuspinnatus TaxID=409849 RepID=UPI002436C3DF|nr:receptor-type tyrosine-protein phosphatase eta [Periophthalmus magnuspinnatus]